MWKDFIKKYDKFIIDGENVMLEIQHYDWESDERFISKIEEAIESLPFYPRIVYDKNRVILVV